MGSFCWKTCCGGLLQTTLLLCTNPAPGGIWGEEHKRYLQGIPGLVDESRRKKFPAILRKPHVVRKNTERSSLLVQGCLSHELVTNSGSLRNIFCTTQKLSSIQ